MQAAGFEARVFRLCISRFQAMSARRDDKRDGSYFVAPTAASTIVVTHWIERSMPMFRLRYLARFATYQSSSSGYG